MNKYIIIAAALLALASAAPQQILLQQQQQQQQQEPARILRQESDVTPEGYQFIYETSDGTARQEQGVLKQIDEETKALEVTGNYRYVSPDGLVYMVSFIANEHGFQPQERIERPGQDSQGFAQQ